MVNQKFFALPLETKRSYEIPELRTKRLCFFGTEHAKQKRRRFKRIGILTVCVCRFKNTAEYPENVEVKELPVLMCKKPTKC
jgi:hypothetical protein